MNITPMPSCVQGDIQSCISRAFILVGKEPWLTTKQSRSARLWQFMVSRVTNRPRRRRNLGPLDNLMESQQGNKPAASSPPLRSLTTRWRGKEIEGERLKMTLTYRVNMSNDVTRTRLRRMSHIFSRKVATLRDC
jgi:hypothetical protein